MNSEFSFRTRSEALRRFRSEVFDLLIVGGGITGAACARDAASRGLRVALIEKGDFSSGTSSASSKLIHGGLRYLENFEFHLVFEALSERAHLIRTAPNMVRWLKFHLPVYRDSGRGKTLLSAGLWLYDLLALGRAPHFHRRLSRRQMLEQVPGLNPDGLVGGFTYYDAMMWDDVLVIESARAAKDLGAAVANYVEALAPIWSEGAIQGLVCEDRESGESFSLRAKRTLFCVGPQTDRVAEMLVAAPEARAQGLTWKRWLEPSRGVHLVFDRERFPVESAMLMTHPKDGRVSFVIPREDFGSGVVVVGTTDAPSPENPDEVRVEASDEIYLLELLGRYFPDLKLTKNDVISSYVGVRPLVGAGSTEGSSQNLQKVSREHFIDRGPGGTVFVAGGKYTTARLMGLEIVDFALKVWEEDYWKGTAPRVPPWHQPQVEGPANPAVTPEALEQLRAFPQLPREWIERYGADAIRVSELERDGHTGRAPTGALSDPPGFPGLSAELSYAIHHEMALHLEDFYFRRMPLYLSRRDHGTPWIEQLSRVWAKELGHDPGEAAQEQDRLKQVFERRKQGYRS